MIPFIHCFVALMIKNLESFNNSLIDLSKHCIAFCFYLFSLVRLLSHFVLLCTGKMEAVVMTTVLQQKDGQGLLRCSRTFS